MTKNVEYSSRFAIDPVAAAAMGTDELRHNFHLADLFQPGRISLTYTHYDRMIVGGAVPLGAPLALAAIKPTGTASFLDRRELIAFNVGGAGSIVADGEVFSAGPRDMVYLGRGARDVSFASDDGGQPAKFYLLSAPAHASHPSKLIRIADAKRLDLGSQATSNERSIFQFIHADGVKTCQLVVGMTQLAPGSIWNTMPCHVHDRRMEVYLYFDLADTARVFHFLGEPDQTRHIVMANEEAVLSPPWSIHSGAGTSNYAFVWAMAGDNVDYADVDAVAIGDLEVTDLSAFGLEGRRVLVTGANTGIGQGIAVSVARAGGAVLGVGRSAMDDTAAKVAAAGGSFTGISCDLGDAKAAQAMLDAAWEAHGPIDGLVNNAGIIRRADAVDFTEADWDEVMDINLKSLFFLTQAFARRVLGAGRRGKVVNIASVLSFQGGIRVPSYTASKHGALGITRLLACEWAAKGINVNAIAPGYIETNNTVALRADPDRSAAILGRIPAARWGGPDDIGDAAVFLLARASDYVHGAALPVDGGWLAR